MDKETYKNALADGSIIIVGTKFTKNGWTQFKVYRIHNIKTMLPHMDWLEPVIVEQGPYWSKKNGTYKCSAFGTDRRLEVILSIGYALGLEFDEIKQNYRWLQDTY